MLHRVLQTYIDKASYIKEYIKIYINTPLYEDIYQEFYIYMYTRPELQNKISENDEELKVINFIKGCLKYFKKSYFRQYIHRTNLAGCYNWVNTEEIDIEFTQIEYLPYEEFENDNDMKILVIKLKERFPEFTGLARMVDKSLAGDDIFIKENKAKNHALIKHLKVNHSERLIDFKETYGKEYL